MTDTDRIMEFHKWTNYLRNRLMYVTASSFVKNQDAIMNGTYTGELPEDGPHKYTVRILKAEMYNLYLRFRMVIDFLVSMSDGYALEYYKKINAIAY